MVMVMVWGHTSNLPHCVKPQALVQEKTGVVILKISCITSYQEVLNKKSLCLRKFDMQIFSFNLNRSA